MNYEIKTGRLVPSTDSIGGNQGLDADSRIQSAIDGMLASIADADLRASIRGIFEDPQWMANVFADLEIEVGHQPDESNLNHDDQLPPAAMAVAA